MTALILTLAWRSRLPERIAVHWSATAPDRFAPPMQTAWVFVLVICIVGGGATVLAAFAQALLLMRRMLLMIGVTVIGLLLTLYVEMLRVQLDRTDAAGIRLPANAIALGVVLGFIVGAVGAGLLRDYRVRAYASQPPASTLPRATPVPVRTSAGFGWAGVVVFCAVGGGLAVLGCVLAEAYWPLAISIPVIILIAALMRFEIIVDRRGIRVTNFGFATIDIALAEVVGAKITEVNPFKDFGGWGLRTRGHRRYGIVTHTGPAVQIDTASGLQLTISLSRAETITGIINGFADQRFGEDCR
ncbi:DUF1648 domain-containing protein [Skermania sp. ID1734]|uniref:DUF1648 domain-containing protein n=1 Tax=Skermania sp. ID1734 TaxID=2597516 RepID=UPI002103BE8B|nr:DUF1648 domain-containing protein [Skermania sp. ID1734]